MVIAEKARAFGPAIEDFWVDILLVLMGG
jgi:uncharacterized membrane protein YqaE (UPF0057 family)